MAQNTNLSKAKKAKNDEFYTQYSDIEAEMNAYYEFNHDVFKGKTILCPCDDPEWSNFTRYFAANFKRFGLKKLIFTSYAKSAGNQKPTLFESSSPLYDPVMHETHGKIFTLTGDTDGSGIIDTNDIEFTGYLEGDGDFRSEEVTRLRDEADMIITNPPFSLFREFLKWIMDADKQFIIIGNMNAITYKEVFPLLKNNEIWCGTSSFGGGMNMIFPSNSFDASKVKKYSIDRKGNYIINVMGVIWYTNVDHGKRHEPLILDTMAHNLKFNRKLKNKLKKAYGDASKYPKYDNYDAIEVPFTECIPSDYDGIMGVPISFMDKYCPEQFEIIWTSDRGGDGMLDDIRKPFTRYDAPVINGRGIYKRIFIRSIVKR
ncbi:adenine-specific methyltransferase EcoRI family protein [Catenisphaera adipataccumulans]|uniref:DNA methyltransferase n=1 Tax=Catenisphaera adipataccumulans TaxID=700500 RepID=A0A7W8FYG5_9FIRM|nr:adenine-specific methyltransferase EcoRI family protein [Catenisphaera adipataccumulans]MBB5183967.1 hypothetical protein [Catenisphaera adipataccumulans]